MVMFLISGWQITVGAVRCHHTDLDIRAPIGRATRRGPWLAGGARRFPQRAQPRPGLPAVGRQACPPGESRLCQFPNTHRLKKSSSAPFGPSSAAVICSGGGWRRVERGDVSRNRRRAFRAMSSGPLSCRSRSSMRASWSSLVAPGLARWHLPREWGCSRRSPRQSPAVNLTRAARSMITSRRLDGPGLAAGTGRPRRVYVPATCVFFRRQEFSRERQGRDGKRHAR